jgi:hypothetical protein
MILYGGLYKGKEEFTEEMRVNCIKIGIWDVVTYQNKQSCMNSERDKNGDKFTMEDEICMLFSESDCNSIYLCIYSENTNKCV